MKEQRREFQGEEPLHAGEILAEGEVQPIEEAQTLRLEREEGVRERHFEEGGRQIGGFEGSAGEGDDRVHRLEQQLAAAHQDLHRAQREADGLRGEIGRARDQTNRAMADLDNWRKRYTRDLDRELMDQKKALLLTFLPIADNMERAVASARQASRGGTDGVEALLKGVAMVLSMFQEALRRQGVARLEAQDAPFDPTYHEAIGTRGEDPAAAGHVVEVVEQGYTLNGEVVRPAKVLVGGGRTEMATSTPQTLYEGP